jgi:hypothetical protein
VQTLVPGMEHESETCVWSWIHDKWPACKIIFLDSSRKCLDCRNDVSCMPNKLPQRQLHATSAMRVYVRSTTLLSSLCQSLKRRILGKDVFPLQIRSRNLSD